MKISLRLKKAVDAVKRIASVFDLRDAHAYLGLLMIGAGLCWVSIPAALCLCGLLIFWMGVRD